MSLSRRQFLAGLGVAGVAAAGAGLAGCAASPQPASSGNTEPVSASADAGSAGQPASTELIAQAYVNPQDYDYRQNSGKLDTLFSPWKIGPVEIGHRMVKSAAGSATFLGGLTDEFAEYYKNFARGGVELIWIEGEMFTVNPETLEVDPSVIEFGKKLAADCGELGAKMGYQWAYSDFVNNVNDFTTDQIAHMEEIGVAAAKACKEMGLIGMEINAAGFNMGEQFLSRFHNQRTDEYGCTSIENRSRFVVETIKKIKQACGDDFVVQVLIDAVEENDNLTNNGTLMNLDHTLTVPRNRATTIEEGIEIAKQCEAAGADSMHLRLGPLGNHPCQFGSDLYFLLNGIEGATGYGTQWDFSRHFQGQLIADHSGAGMLLDVVARYKEALSIPCGTVTYMDPAHAPDFFEAALADGKADFYLMTRPLTVDPDYVNKLREGRADEIAPCTRCLHCHIGSNQLNRMMGYCRVNALTQRVMTENGPATYELPAAETKKKVMVVGGGPAGMEAARVAALRGHDVTLYEKKSSLGGLLDFAHNVKGPHENLVDLKDYLIRQCELAGVSVVTGTEVDAALVNSEAPDALILATGGVRDTSAVSGSGVPIVDFESFQMADMGDDVVVYGSNAQAYDAALWLTVHKKNVTMVTPSTIEELDMQQSQHAHRFMTTALYALGMPVWTESKIESMSADGIVVATGFGTKVEVPCSAVVNAADMLPNKSLLDEVSVSETYAIGDCDQPFNIALAIRGGNDAGRAV